MSRRILLGAPLLLAATAEDAMPPHRDSGPLDAAAIPAETLAVLRRAEAHLRARPEPRFGPLRAIGRQVHFGLVNGIGAHDQARMRFDRQWAPLPMTREGDLAGLFPLAGWRRNDRVLCVFGRTSGAVVPCIVLTNPNDA